MAVTSDYPPRPGSPGRATDPRLPAPCTRFLARMFRNVSGRPGREAVSSKRRAKKAKMVVLPSCRQPGDVMAWTKIGTALLVLSTLVAACDDDDGDGDSTVADGGRRIDGGSVDGGPDAQNDSPPVATDGTGTTDEDVELDGQLVATDADGNPLVFSVTGEPMHGTVEVSADGSFTYTPAADYSGPDEFSFG